MSAPIAPLSCNRCRAPLPVAHFNRDEMGACAACRNPFQALVFPAILRAAGGGEAPLAAAGEQEASCFYHASKKAVTVCEGCGVFLCALCDVVMVDRHLCPRCLEKGRSKGRIRDLQNERFLYDDLALSLSLLPLLIFYFTIVTAPIALYVAIRYWNAPGSLIPRTRVRLVFAIALSSLQVAGWVFLAVWLATH